MIKFFRKLRSQLLAEGRTGHYMKYAAGEIILVVVGILIALQINNWNQARKDRAQEIAILKSLQFDLREDKSHLIADLEFDEEMIAAYMNCLTILSEKKEGMKEDIMRDLKSILQVGGITMNKTTFSNLQSNGEIRLIRDKMLADSIVLYYNADFMGWFTALRDYTRNIIGPYLMEFDYLPNNLGRNERDDFILLPGKPGEYVMPERKLEDYKNNYFIINMLRQKIFSLNGLVAEYKNLVEFNERLDLSIQKYLEES